MVRQVNETTPLFVFEIRQGAKVFEIKWIRNNLEGISANIGGITSFMTVLVAFCLAPHQDHHYEQNLVSKLYTTEPNDKDPLVAQLDKVKAKENEDDDEDGYDEKGKDLINKLKTRVPI